MNFYILTLFDDMIYNYLNYSIMKRAINNKLINVNVIDIRDFSNNKHKKVDDYPYGGGAGMVMKALPIINAYNSIKDKLSEKKITIYMSPKGKILNQGMCQNLIDFDDIVILCGHYEGVDQRAIDEIVDLEISIGDYILTGGELPALILLDSISRLIKGVLGKEESFENESFSNYLLEHSHYTRPFVVNGKEVPKVLLSGNHKQIEKFRLDESIEITKKNRTDLYNEYLNRNK